MATTKTIPQLERVQVMLRGDLVQQIDRLRATEDRSQSKMAAILIEEALVARADSDEKVTQARA